MSSSCARQALLVKYLWEAGCEMRILKPPTGGFSSVRAKALFLDERLACIGSVKLIHNGMERNKEHLIRVTYPRVVVKMVADYEETWRMAVVVTPVYIQTMMEAWNKSNETKAKEKETKIDCWLCLSLSMTRLLERALRLLRIYKLLTSYLC